MEDNLDIITPFVPLRKINGTYIDLNTYIRTKERLKIKHLSN